MRTITVMIYSDRTTTQFEDNGSLRIKGVGIIFHGGTNESVEMTSGVVTGLNISAIGFTTE